MIADCDRHLAVQPDPLPNEELVANNGCSSRLQMGINRLMRRLNVACPKGINDRLMFAQHLICPAASLCDGQYPYPKLALPKGRIEICEDRITCCPHH